MAASGHYDNKYTRVQSKRKVKRGIIVGCVNTGIMQQIEEWKLLFDHVPPGTDDVHLFYHIQEPLIIGGKFVCNGCNLVFDIPNSHILTGETKEAICNIINDAAATKNKDILMTVPFNHDTNTWQINQTNTSECSKHVANNLHWI